jgi:MFS family permease
MIDKVITCLCIIFMLNNSSFSLLAPFYPIEVAEKGIDSMWTGFLMAMQAFAFIISSFVTGKYLNNIGRINGMVVGILLIILSMIGFGCLDFIYNKYLFIAMSVFFKFMCGFG